MEKTIKLEKFLHHVILKKFDFYIIRIFSLINRVKKIAYHIFYSTVLCVIFLILFHSSLFANNHYIPSALLSGSGVPYNLMHIRGNKWKVFVQGDPVFHVTVGGVPIEMNIKDLLTQAFNAWNAAATHAGLTFNLELEFIDESAASNFHLFVDDEEAGYEISPIVSYEATFPLQEDTDFLTIDLHNLSESLHEYYTDSIDDNLISSNVPVSTFVHSVLLLAVENAMGHMFSLGAPGQTIDYVASALSDSYEPIVGYGSLGEVAQYTSVNINPPSIMNSIYSFVELMYNHNNIAGSSTPLNAEQVSNLPHINSFDGLALAALYMPNLLPISEQSLQQNAYAHAQFASLFFPVPMSMFAWRSS